MPGEAFGLGEGPSDEDGEASPPIRFFLLPTRFFSQFVAFPILVESSSIPKPSPSSLSARLVAFCDGDAGTIAIVDRLRGRPSDPVAAGVSGVNGSRSTGERRGSRSSCRRLMLLRRD